MRAKFEMPSVCTDLVVRSTPPDIPMTEIEHPDDLAPPSRPRWQTTAIGVGFMLAFAAALIAMRTIPPGATLIVEADEPTSVLLNTRVVRIHQRDGSLVQPIVPGRQRVRAGKYQLRANIDGIRMEYSTGETFEIAKGETLRMTVKRIVEGE